MAATCSMSFNTHGLAMRGETIYGGERSEPQQTDYEKCFTLSCAA